jgi:2'-5' RNA ligase
MGTIRTFLAIELPNDIRAALGQVNRELAAQMPGRAVRWVAPDRMHLTVRFLGDTATSKLPAISGGLDQVTSKLNSFVLRLDKLGCFPNRKRPRVIWVGLHGDTTSLRSLHKGIESLLAPIGWEPENRPFRPHLTLGRVRDSRKLRGIEWQATVPKSQFAVTAVHLIESQLLPTGPIYTFRHTSVLGDS